VQCLLASEFSHDENEFTHNCGGVNRKMSALIKMYSQGDEGVFPQWRCLQRWEMRLKDLGPAAGIRRGGD
jgi:hypothetical protein